MSDADGDSSRPPFWSIGLLTAVLRHLPEGVCLASTDDLILYANDVFDRVFGTPVGGWAGQSARLLLSPGSPDPPWLGHPPLERRSSEVRLHRLDGTVFPASHTFVRLNDGAGPVTAHLHLVEDLTGSRRPEPAKVVIARRDITSDRDREHALRCFSRSLLSAQEAERKRVAGELHDGLAQSLAALIVTLRGLESDLRPDDDRPRARVREAASAVRALIEDARRIAHNLTPAVLEDIGLTAAIDRLMRTFFGSAGISVERQAIPLDGLFRPEDEIHIYRVVQEIFNNIHRHARARRVDVAIRRAGGAVEFEVRDDGVGFSVGEAAFATPEAEVHLGLRGLQERARLLNGTLAIRSKPGAGTTILLSIPASARRRARQPSA
jgi:signal transduction histidine kinase